jgi:hypothetical protein
MEQVELSIRQMVSSLTLLLLVRQSTILIRTKKAYDIEPRHMEVRSFDDCITLQYVDIDEDGLQATVHLQ